MSGPFWIGTRERFLETRMPSVVLPSGKSGWYSELNYLNGGASTRKSTAASKRYDMTWNSISYDDAQVILDLADGLYGDGEIYWLDPIIASRNVLPQWWASPFQGTVDGLPLGGGARPDVVATPPNSLGFPTRSARYTVDPADTSLTTWVPRPDGYTVHVGVYGTAGTGGVVEIVNTDGPVTELSVTNATLLAVSDNSRFNYSTSAGDGVLLRLGGTGTVTLSGLMVQVLPTGTTPQTGSFISGQGHSGCKFADGGQPEWIPYSAVIDTHALTAQFIETGGWAQ